MYGSDSWDVISGVDADGVVLAVDYPAKRRDDGAFADLVARMGPGFRFLQTRPMAARPFANGRGGSYVGPWIEGIRRGHHQVLAVLGYRVGCVYAAAIADGISRWQRMPKVILLDPEYASNADIGRELRTELNSISSLLSDDEMETARKIVVRFPGPAVRSIADAGAEAVQAYREVSLAAFERAGVGGLSYENLTAPFISHISWLSSAGQLDPGPVWRYATALVSSTARSMNDTIGHRIPLEATHTELLRSECAAQAVSDLLAETHTQRT
jgi:hypothetical protein